MGTFGPFEEVGVADGPLGTSLSAQVEAGREGGRRRGPAEGSLGRLASGLGVRWGGPGRTGARRWIGNAEEGPSRLGG